MCIRDRLRSDRHGSGGAGGATARQDRAGRQGGFAHARNHDCLLYTSPSPRDRTRSRMPSSA